MLAAIAKGREAREAREREWKASQARIRKSPEGFREDDATFKREGSLPRGFLCGEGVSGAKERDDARMILGQRVKRGTLRKILAYTEENRTRQYRRDVMREARENRLQMVEEERKNAPTVEVREPLALLREDVKGGLLPRADETVTEEYRLDVGDRHYLTFQLESAGYLVQLERLTRDYKSRTRVVESVMRHPNGGMAKVRGATPWKHSRGVTTLYLTSDDMANVMRRAKYGNVEVRDENTKGVTCVSYFPATVWSDSPAEV